MPILFLSPFLEPYELFILFIYLFIYIYIYIYIIFIYNNKKMESVDSDTSSDTSSELIPDCDPQFQAPNFSKGQDTLRGLCTVCTVCCRSMPVRRDGFVRVHGPVGHRCQGSAELPQRAPHTLPSDGDCTQQTISRPIDINIGSLSRDTISFPRVKLLRRLPSASRALTTKTLSNILNQITRLNNHESWKRLLLFPSRFRVPRRGGRRWNLAKLVKQQLLEESDPPSGSAIPNRSTYLSHSAGSANYLAKRVSIKMEEGDIKGAVRLACSEDTIALETQETISVLKDKHPPTHPDTKFQDPPPAGEHITDALSVSEADVVKAIKSFPNDSAGGPDGLRLQHLKDMISTIAGPEGVNLLSS